MKNTYPFWMVLSYHIWFYIQMMNILYNSTWEEKYSFLLQIYCWCFFVLKTMAFSFFHDNYPLYRDQGNIKSLVKLIISRLIIYFYEWLMSIDWKSWTIACYWHYSSRFAKWKKKYLNYYRVLNRFSSSSIKLIWNGIKMTRWEVRDGYLLNFIF